MSKTTKGAVKWFNDAKGYGYITPADQPNLDVFVHYTEIEGPGFKTLIEGQDVEFVLFQAPNGPQAKQVIKAGFMPNGVDCGACNDTGEVNGEGCIECCEHDDIDDATCLNCGEDMGEELACRAEWIADAQKDSQYE